MKSLSPAKAGKARRDDLVSQDLQHSESIDARTSGRVRAARVGISPRNGYNLLSFFRLLALFQGVTECVVCSLGVAWPLP
jgi:hypothetical protein